MKHVVLISLFIFLALNGYCFSKDTGNYKDWNYSPTRVFGLVKLNNIHGRTFYKISRKKSSTIVEKVNPRGLTVETNVIEFRDGTVFKISEIDRWDDTFKIWEYEKIKPNDFLVTCKENGQNFFFPCKGAIYHFEGGLLTMTTFLSANNEVMNAKNGMAIIRYKRYTDSNRFSLPLDEELFDKEDNPIIQSGCYKISYDRDERGNIVVERSFAKRNTLEGVVFDAFVTKNKIDPITDNKIKEEYYYRDGTPFCFANGISKIHYLYENGFCSEYLYLDVLGMVVKTNDKLDYSITKHVFDANGNEVRTSFYNEEEKPVNLNAGFSEITYKFSPSNMLIEKAYYDVNHLPTADRSGIHAYKYVNDEKNRKTEEYFFDIYDNSKKNRIDGVYAIKYRYNNNGVEMSQSYWQNPSKKMNRWDGYHEKRKKYDSGGRCTEWSVYDQDGNLCKTKAGYSKQVQVFNDRGLIKEMKWLDDSVPIMHNDSLSTTRGYHCIKYYYNESGSVSHLEYYDAEGRPLDATISMGNNLMKAHKIEFSYSGNVIMSEKWFVYDNDSPILMLNCFQSEYVAPTGLSISPRIINKPIRVD